MNSPEVRRNTSILHLLFLLRYTAFFLSTCVDLKSMYVAAMIYVRRL